MATAQDLKKKALNAQKTKELAAKKQLDIVNKARKLSGHEPIAEKDFAKTKTPSPSKKAYNVVAFDSGGKVKETKMMEEAQTNSSIDSIFEAAHDSFEQEAKNIADKYYNTQLLWGISSKMEKSTEEQAPSLYNTDFFSEPAKPEMETSNTLKNYREGLVEAQNRINEERRLRTEQIQPKGSFSYVSSKSFTTNGNSGLIDLVDHSDSDFGNPKAINTPDYVETEFTFTESEKVSRIKKHPNYPKVYPYQKTNETELQSRKRYEQEKKEQRDFLEKKMEEFVELEEKINSLINPIESVITDENEEFYVNASELADNLAMTELEKDKNFSLEENTDLYNQVYDKYMKLITSFKLDKNA